MSDPIAVQYVIKNSAASEMGARGFTRAAGHSERGEVNEVSSRDQPATDYDKVESHRKGDADVL